MQRQNCAIMLLFYLLLGSWFSFSAVNPQTKQTAAIFSEFGSNDAPGLAVLIVKDGRRVFEREYGVTDLRSRNKITSHTNFRLASLTKQFTAMAVMLLVHDGKLHYDDRLTEVFPEFPAYGKSITLRNLLNHTSGLLDYEDLMPPQPVNTLTQIKDRGVLELLEKQNATKFPPGMRWDYSNSGYSVLAMVVEKVSGKPFGQFLHDRIFSPLKMRNTLAYEKGKNEVANRAYGHSKIHGVWQEADQSPTSAVLGDGGVYTSLDDLFKWDEALRRQTLLSAREMQAAITPGKLAESSRTAYGFGWFLDSYKGHERMHHYGETVGFRTNIQRFTANHLTVIVLCNRDDLVPRDLALKAADLYLQH